MTIDDEILSCVRRPSVPCLPCQALATLSAKDRAEVKRIMNDNTYPMTAVARWLTQKTGMKVADHSLRNHHRSEHK